MFSLSERVLVARCHSLWQSRSFGDLVRLTKRMSELEICSRREADRWIREGLVTVNGKVAEIGEKVESNLLANAIEISTNNDETSSLLSSSDNVTKAVVLNKPPGYVSGQAEHGHLPAIRLLTRNRLKGYSNKEIKLPQNSWKHFAPAGRLDLDSTGLLVFARSGIIAKKLIHSDSAMDKEYVVKVEPTVQETRREKELDGSFRLSRPSLDLSPITRGGGMLLGEYRPLKPCKALWIDKGSTLKIVLREGRKQQIRRMCRELLGYHVVSLERVRIGPICIQDLPQGFWRPLTPHEIEQILAE